MNWLRENRRVALIVTLTLALPLVLWLYLLGSLWSSASAARDEIERLEPRIARYAGVIDARQELLAAAANIKSGVLDLVYPPDSDAGTIGAALQTQVRQLVSGAGLSVQDSRILPARLEGDFQLIGLAVSVTGSLEALDAALHRVAGARPLLLVSGIDIAPARDVRSRGDGAGVQSITARIELISLRAAE